MGSSPDPYTERVIYPWATSGESSVTIAPPRRWSSRRSRCSPHSAARASPPLPMCRTTAWARRRSRTTPSRRRRSRATPSPRRRSRATPSRVRRSRTRTIQPADLSAAAKTAGPQGPAGPGRPVRPGGRRGNSALGVGRPERHAGAQQGRRVRTEEWDRFVPGDLQPGRDGLQSTWRRLAARPPASSLVRRVAAGQLPNVAAGVRVFIVEPHWSGLHGLAVLRCRLLLTEPSPGGEQQLPTRPPMKPRPNDRKDVACEISS